MLREPGRLRKDALGRFSPVGRISPAATDLNAGRARKSHGHARCCATGRVPEGPRNEEARMGRPKAGGLCSTCAVLGTCAHVVIAKKDVLFCEEFEESPGPGLPEVAVMAVAVTTSERGIRALGLCRNCELRASCTLPGSEAGVWHCEEYR